VERRVHSLESRAGEKNAPSEFLIIPHMTETTRYLKETKTEDSVCLQDEPESQIFTRNHIGYLYDYLVLEIIQKVRMA
jgi:hypothetical protein